MSISYITVWTACANLKAVEEGKHSTEDGWKHHAKQESKHTQEHVVVRLLLRMAGDRIVSSVDCVSWLKPHMIRFSVPRHFRIDTLWCRLKYVEDQFNEG